MDHITLKDVSCCADCLDMLELRHKRTHRKEGIDPTPLYRVVDIEENKEKDTGIKIIPPIIKKVK